MSMADEKEQSQGSRTGFWVKIALLLGLIAAAGTAYAIFGKSLSLENLATREAQLRSYQKSAPVVVLAAAFLIYVAVTGLSLPGAAGLTLLCGWYFGFGRGIVLVSFASTTGAFLAFLLSRYLFQEVVQKRFSDRLTKFNQALDREGPYYLFTLRLVPLVPFFIINVVMGLTKIRPRTFWWVSQLGMLPGTAVYVYAGSSVPSLETLAEQGVSGILTPQLILAFVLLGVFPLAVKKLMKWLPQAA